MSDSSKPGTGRQALSSKISETMRRALVARALDPGGRLVLHRRRLERGLPFLHVDLEADGLAGVLLDQLLLVLPELGRELFVGQTVSALAAAVPGGDELLVDLLEVL